MRSSSTRQRCFRASRCRAAARVAVMTNAGGLGILCADACAAAGLALPDLADETREALSAVLPAEASTANPVDLLGSATEVTYAAALPLLLADPGIDALIVLFVPPVVAGAEEVASAIRNAVETARPGKPVLACVISHAGTPAAFRDGCTAVATFAYPESAAHALGLAADRAEWLRRPTGPQTEPAEVDRLTARRIVDDALAAGTDGWLEPERARGLLEAYGVPVVAERKANTARSGCCCCRGARLSGRRQDGRARRSQDREWRSCARSRRRGGRARGGRGDRASGGRPAVRPDRHRVARRSRPGSRLRPAGRVRPRAACWRS